MYVTCLIWDCLAAYRTTHIQSHQSTPCTAVYCTKLVSCPQGRSCHPRPWLMHRSRVFTHLDLLALPPAGSQRLNSPHIGLLDIAVVAAGDYTCFFPNPVSKRSGSYNTNWSSHMRDMFISSSHFLLYIKFCAVTYM